MRDALKSAAHAAVAQAVRDGMLVRSDVCEGCDRRVEVEGHHDDYTKPLVVRWLCKGCHTDHHVRAGTYVHEAHAEKMRRWWASPAGAAQRILNREHAARRALKAA